MQSVTRRVGKLMNRGPGDNAKVSVLLNDYEDADRVLAKVILAVVSLFFIVSVLFSPFGNVADSAIRQRRLLKTRKLGKSPGTTSSPHSLT